MMDHLRGISEVIVISHTVIRVDVAVDNRADLAGNMPS